MKKLIPYYLVFLLLSNVNGYSQLSLNSLVDYSLFAKHSIILDTNLVVQGKVGTIGIDQPSNLTSNGLEINNSAFIMASNDLDLLMNEIVSDTYTSISFNNTGPNFITPGKYKHSGNADFNDLIHFTGGANDTYTLFIDGDLSISQSAGFNLANTIPSNIVIYVSGELSIESNSIFMESLSQMEIVRLKPEFQGNFLFLLLLNSFMKLVVLYLTHS